MKLWVQRLDQVVNRGVLTGVLTPYASRHGIPVAYTDEMYENGNEALVNTLELAQPGMVVCSIREDILYAIDSDGDAHVLPLRVEVASVGLQALLYAEEATDPRGGPVRHKVRGYVDDEAEDSDGSYVIISRVAPEDRGR